MCVSPLIHPDTVWPAASDNPCLKALRQKEVKHLSAFVALNHTAYCEKCRHRLPIQHKLLEWEKTERYQVWEVEEEDKAGCYRIISFPIEWKERPSCVHIVMDITAEKMNARQIGRAHV